VDFQKAAAGAAAVQSASREIGALLASMERTFRSHAVAE
jgi:hypothetical protein